jgi:lipoprotein-releasing system permease protein
VKLNLKYLFAARYVRSPKSHSVINIISGVSIVAMAVPVAAIILLLSIFNGLEKMTLELYQSIDADLVITPNAGITFPIEELDSAAISSVAGIEKHSYVLEQSALAEIGDNRTIVSVKGVDQAYTSVVPLADNLMLGEFTTHADSIDYVVAAFGVLQDLSSLRATTVGTTLNLYAINRARISTLIPVGGYTRRTLPIAGIYSVDEENRSMVITSLQAAQSLFNYPGRASSIEVKILEGESADAIAEQLQQAVGDKFEVRTREQSNSIYRLMALEKWGVFFIAVLVMVVASLSIVGTLVMVVIDKRDDIHTLRTLGARADLVRGIFIAEGRLMAAISLVIGLLLGVGLALLQQCFGFVGIDAETLMVNAYPVEVHLIDILLTIVAYAVVSYLVVNLTVRALLRENNKE